MIRFPLALAAAHLPVLLACAGIAWSWSGAKRRTGPVGWWLFTLVAHAVLFGTAFVAGVAIMVLLRHLHFAVLRFIAQVLFGELPLLLGLLGWFHVRERASRTRALPFLILAVVLLAVYTEAYHHCPYNLQVRTHAVDITHGRPATGTLRILHLSDLQTYAIRPYERKVLAQLVSLQPDLIVFSGDYIQSRYRPTRRVAGEGFTKLLRELQLRPRYGVYAVQGDVEQTDWPTLFDGTGIHCLENSSERVKLAGGRTLSLTGLTLTTSRNPKKEDLARLFQSAKSDYRLVVGHAPDYVNTLPEGLPVDLALAGHTHGGQIVVPGYGPPLILSNIPRNYAGGLNRYHDVPLHVSRGVGMERGPAPQVRLFCPPEICILEVRY